MQPIRLKLENFGPYENSLIDFSDFYAQSLFLITGKTGAGKTTIFDGMTYALYGSTSGGLRQGKEMRSNFADAGERTRVVFTFKQESKTYELIREPEQLVKKQRGEGFREQPATVRLTVFDEKGIEIQQLTKQKEVGPYLSELIQLNESQFSQIVMLPQGEFRRFLNADSDSKEKVLRKLFNTYFYQEIADSLRKQKKEQEVLLKDKSQELSLLVGQLEWEETFKEQQIEEMYYQDVLVLYEKQESKYQSDEITKQNELGLAQKRLAEQDERIQVDKKWLDYFNEMDQVYAKQAELKLKKVSILEDKKQVILLKDIEKISPTYTAYLELEKDHKKLVLKEQELLAKQDIIRASLKEKQVYLSKLLLEKGQIDISKKELASLEISLPLFERKDQLEIEKKEIQKKQETILKQDQELSREQAELTSKCEEIQNTLLEQPELIEEKFILIQQEKANQERIKEINRYREYVSELESIKRENEKILKKIEENKQHNIVKSDLQKQVKNDWAKAQIAKLSLDLIDGESCPVCGSLEHPKPFHAEIITKDEMIQLETSLEEAEQELSRIKEEKVSLRKSIEFKEQEQNKLVELIDNLKVTISHLFISTVSEINWLSESKKEAKKLEEAQVINQKKQENIEEKRVALEKMNKRQQAILERLTEVEKNHRELENKLLQLEVAHREVKERLPEKWQTLAEVIIEKQRVHLLVSTWEQEVEQLKLQEVDLGQQRLVNTTRLENEISQKEIMAIKLAQEKEKVDFFNLDHELNNSLLGEYLKQLDQLTNLEDNIQRFEKEEYALEEEIRKISGILKDRQKPDLEPLIVLRDELVMSVEKNQAILSTLQYKIKQNQKLVLTVREKEKDIKEQLESLEELTTLANVMTGDGPNKLSMERFVLQTYLKRILKRGNEKLLLLTNGRYRFVLREEQGSFKKKTGLEINIFDDNVGALRGVNTLSGGESFIAALSLALSLAEVIQEESGGIKIDAMFIDEGFGSLDEDALEMAIRALETIEGDGRLIGIISHVRELKERIPQQLQVKSTLDGKSYVTERLEFE